MPQCLSLRSFLLFSTPVLLLFFAVNHLKAEGTKQTTPYNASSGSVIQLQINRSAQGGSPSTFAGWTATSPGDRLYIRISNYQTERVYLGFQKANSGQNVFFRIKRPDGTVVYGPTAIPTSGTGYISTWSQANIGPANLTGNAGGYTGLVFNPNANANSQLNGDFYIEFNTSSSAANTNEIFLQYYDITVANGTSNTNVKNGRLWSYNWGFNSQSFNAGGYFGSLYSYTADQIVTEIDLNGLQPYYFRVFNNQWGPRNDSTIQVNRRSKQGSSGVYQYRLFLNNPDSVAFPSNPDADRNITFNGLTGCDSVNCFNITIDGPATIFLMIDFNNNGSYLDPIDRILEQTVVAGNNCLNWDGKDGLGNPVPGNTVITITIATQVGVTHLPFYDVENHPNGYLARLVRPLGIGTLTMYYDNSALSNQGGVVSSSNLAGTVPPLPVGGNSVNTNGINKWQTTSGSVYYGDDRTINTWWTIRKYAALNLQVTKPRCVDIAVSKTDSSVQFIPGQITTYTLTAVNNGPDPVLAPPGSPAIRITDSLPAGTTMISWTALFFGGASGTAAGTGQLDQQVSMPLNSSVKYVVQVNVPVSYNGQRIINTVTGTPPAGTVETNPLNNIAKDTSYRVLQLSGTVWNDRNNSANGTFANVFTAGETAPPIASLLYVSLVRISTNQVLQSVPVSASGSFSLAQVAPLNSDLKLILSQVPGLTGQQAPGMVLPSRWFGTTPLQRNIVTDTLNLAGLDFGVRNQRARADINQSIRNMPVSGDLSSNDDALPGSSYALLGSMSNGTMQLNPNGTYTYTPQAGFVGQDSVRYVLCTAAPGVLCDTATLVIRYTDQYNNRMNEVLAQDDVASTLSGLALNICVRCNDSDPNGQVLGLPVLIASPQSGTAVPDTNGNILYTPAAGFAGRDRLRYRISDNASPLQWDTANVYIDVLPNPQTVNMTVANDDALMTSVNLAVSGQAGSNDSDPGGGSMSFAVIANPQNGSLVFSSNGNFTYTPFNGYTGPDRFVYSKCDNGSPAACDTATVYIAVNRPQQETNPDLNTTLVNVTVTGNVSTNDQVPAGTSYGTAIALAGNPGPAMPAMNANGTYSFVSAVQGVFRFSVPVCVPGVQPVCRGELLTITVLPVGGPYPPMANTDIASTLVNVPVTLVSLSNDVAALGYSLLPGSVQVTAGPLHGTATVNPLNGNITYTPASGYIGQDTLTYQVCQNTSPQTCATAIQVITVIPVSLNNTTSASDDVNLTPLNTACSGNVKANDNDAEGHPQTVTPQTTTVAGKGTLVLAASGTYSFTPVAGYVGPVEFVYTVCDNQSPAACAQATLHIDVMPPDLAVNLTLNPTIAQGPTNLQVIVTVSELNYVNTAGPITVFIPKDVRFAMTYNPSAQTIGLTAVNNALWTYNGSNPYFHVFTTNAVITGGSAISFGFEGMFTPGAKNGTNTVSASLLSNSGTDWRNSNNSDSETLIFFH